MAWDDDDSIEEDKRKMRENWAKVKESWKQITDDAEERDRLQREWQLEVERIISDPDALDRIAEDKLQHIRIRAKNEIERLRGGKSRLERTRREGNIKLGNTGLGGLLNLFSDIGENSVSGQIQKNRTVIELVDVKLKALRSKPPALPAAPATPPPDPAAQIIAELAEEHRKMEDALKNNPPELHQDIKRVYGQRMDAIRKKIGP